MKDKPTLPPESEDKGSKDSEVTSSPKGEVEPVELMPAPPSPPNTKTPVQFNQQINVYQIPQSAWSQLSSDQIVDLSKVVLQHANEVDERHFKFAMATSRRDSSGKKWATSVGGIITIAGFGAAAFLAYSGNTLAAIAIALPLATILATVVGNRFLD